MARRVGPRRLGLRRRRWLLVLAGPLGRHAQDRGQAPGAGRGRIDPRRPSGRGRGGCRRRAARGEGRGRRLLRGPQARTRAIGSAARGAVRARGPRDGQGAQARARAVRARPAEDTLGEDHAARDPRDVSRPRPGRSLLARESGCREGGRRRALITPSLASWHLACRTTDREVSSMEVIAVAEREHCWRWEIRHNGQTVKEWRERFTTLTDAIEDGKRYLLVQWMPEERPPISRRPWRQCAAGRSCSGHFAGAALAR